jgi:hypothetical protein
MANGKPSPDKAGEDVKKANSGYRTDIKAKIIRRRTD